MLMRKVLEQETWEQLCKRAKDLNIPDYSHKKKEHLLSAILLAANKGEEPKEPKPAPEPDDFSPSPEPNPAPKNTLPREDSRIWFKVAAGHTEMEKGPVFAALNGESVLIKRNHWVKLKSYFLPIFSDAVCTEVDIDGQGATHLRQVPRFNYEVRSLAEGKPQEPELPRGF